jgi:hypothetical protein
MLSGAAHRTSDRHRSYSLGSPPAEAAAELARRLSLCNLLYFFPILGARSGAALQLDLNYQGSPGVIPPPRERVSGEW